jgi:hypothetical protein
MADNFREKAAANREIFFRFLISRSKLGLGATGEYTDFSLAAAMSADGKSTPPQCVGA